MRDILLIPGFMCTSALWVDMQAELEALGRLHFCELDTGTSIREFAERILERAPAEFFVVGFSMGGYVAREIALRARERVRGLVLVNTSTRGTPPEEQVLNLQRIELARRGNFTGLSREAIERVLAPEHRVDANLVSRIRSMSRSLGKDVFIRQLGIVREDGLDQCRLIDCPTLVVASGRDELRLPEESTEMAGAIPGATLQILNHSGHMAPLEAPAELAELIVEWVKGR